VANNDISISIEDGTGFTGLIGPNGSGKSTLFKSINGFNRIDEGEILFKGKPISKMATYNVCRLGIACTFQHSQMFRTLSLEESVLMGAYCRNNRKKDGLRAAREKINFVGLSGREDVLISKLDMLERKKAEFAAALSTEPELLLLDELFAGLLPTELSEMIDIVRQANKKYNVAFFIVEHVLRVIMSICENVHVLENGKLIASGKPEEITKNEDVIRAYLGRDYVAAGS